MVIKNTNQIVCGNLHCPLIFFNMEDGKGYQKVTISDILKVFKTTKECKRMKEIKEAVVSLFTPNGEIFNEHQAEIEADIIKLINDDRKLGKDSELEYRNGKYSKRKRVLPPPPGSANSNYIGAAGECAVMSELLFAGYNVNRMMVDEGVDIVAVKDNIYYYVQVKTTIVKENGNITCSIDKERQAQYIGNQMRYIIVARTKDHSGAPKNIFFKFSPNDIQQAIFNQCISVGTRINIKIKFNTKTGEPILYDNKEMPIGYFMNNFTL